MNNHVDCAIDALENLIVTFGFKATLNWVHWNPTKITLIFSLTGLPTWNFIVCQSKAFVYKRFEWMFTGVSLRSIFVTHSVLFFRISSIYLVFPSKIWCKISSLVFGLRILMISLQFVLFLEQTCSVRGKITFDRFQQQLLRKKEVFPAYQFHQGIPE